MDEGGEKQGAIEAARGLRCLVGEGDSFERPDGGAGVGVGRAGQSVSQSVSLSPGPCCLGSAPNHHHHQQSSRR